MIETEPQATAPRTYYQGNGTRYKRAEEHIEETTENIFTERKWWRYGCLIALGVIVILVLVVVGLALRAAYEPVYIKVNSEEQLQVLRWDAFNPEAETIKKELIRWLRCVRDLPTDAETLDYCWKMVPRFLLEKTQAIEVVKHYYKTVNPKSLLFHKKVVVSDVKGRQEPDKRWRFEWTETVYGFREKAGVGRAESTTRMSAVMSTTRRKPTTRKDIELNGEVVNPLGIYVTSLSWGD